MKRCTVLFKNGYACFAADRIEREEGLAFVYNGGELTAVFDLGFIDAMYLSDMKEEKA